MGRKLAIRHGVAENINGAVVIFPVGLIIEALKAAGSFALSARMARSNMALASASEPVCWATVDPQLPTNVKATNAATTAPFCIAPLICGRRRLRTSLASQFLFLFETQDISDQVIRLSA
jgi:hypothetical protein